MSVITCYSSSGPRTASLSCLLPGNPASSSPLSPPLCCLLPIFPLTFLHLICFSSLLGLGRYFSFISSSSLSAPYPRIRPSNPQIHFLGQRSNIQDKMPSADPLLLPLAVVPKVELGETEPQREG